MEVEVAELFRIIGEQQTEIRALRKQLLAQQPVEEPASLQPVSEERVAEVKEMFSNG